MTEVRAVLKWGSGEWQTVLFACGHRLRLRRAEVKRAQFYEGKRIECGQCRKETKN